MQRWRTFAHEDGLIVMNGTAGRLASATDPVKEGKVKIMVEIRCNLNVVCQMNCFKRKFYD